MAKKVWAIVFIVLVMGIIVHWGGNFFNSKNALTILPAPPAVFTDTQPSRQDVSTPSPMIRQIPDVDYSWLFRSSTGRLRGKLTNLPLPDAPQSVAVKAKPLRPRYSKFLRYAYQPPLIKNALAASERCMVFPNNSDCRGRGIEENIRADYVVDNNRINRIIYDVFSREQISDTIIWLDPVKKPRAEYMYTQNYLPSSECCSLARWIFDRKGNISHIELTDEKGRFGIVKYAPNGAITQDTTPLGGPIPKDYTNRPRRYCDIHPFDSEICSY